MLLFYIGGYYLTRIREAVAPLILQIMYDKTGAVHNSIGLFRTEAAYVWRYGATFPKLAIVGAYNPSRSAQIARRTRQRDGRRHNSSSPLSLVHGSASSGIWRQSTLKSHRRTSSITSNWRARSGMPSIFWRCITKCSAITSRARKSPSI